MRLKWRDPALAQVRTYEGQPEPDDDGVQAVDYDGVGREQHRPRAPEDDEQQRRENVEPASESSHNLRRAAGFSVIPRRRCSSNSLLHTCRVARQVSGRHRTAMQKHTFKVCSICVAGTSYSD